MPDFDAIVIGAGFGGLYELYLLRQQGLKVRLFERGFGVGGTWFWNRYPGAMSDTESPFYRYSFDSGLLADGTWKRKYIDQPDILAYLESVADRFKLNKDIQLNTEVKAMHWDDAQSIWRVHTTSGVVTAKYVVTALGLLAAVNYPNIPGMDKFKGKLVHTAEWPEDLNVDGQRAGVIGTGSTGCQFIVAAARTASKLTVFQRSPQYSVPSGNGPVEDGEVDSYKRRYPEIWKQVRGSTVGFGFEESTISAMSVDDEERERIYEHAWERGNGFYFMFGAFNDIATNPEANETAASFIRKKIKETVTDPETARKLTPTEIYAKRPLCNHKYFEVYNQENVELVSIKENPIVEITEKGVRTEDGVEHELDILVFATGFDAVDGNYRRIDIRGRGGVTINEHWDTPSSYLGIVTSSFPNMFMITGPNGPFTNLVPAIEVQVEFVNKLIADSHRTGDVVEVSPSTEEKWTETCASIANATLFSKVDSWIFGANIPGKKHSVLFYLGGLGKYLGILDQVEKGGFAEFKVGRAAEKGSEAVTRIEEVVTVV